MDTQSCFAHVRLLLGTSTQALPRITHPLGTFQMKIGMPPCYCCGGSTFNIGSNVHLRSLSNASPPSLPRVSAQVKKLSLLKQKYDVNLPCETDKLCFHIQLEADGFSVFVLFLQSLS